MSDSTQDVPGTLSDDDVVDVVDAHPSSRRGALQLLGLTTLGAALSAFFGIESEAEAQRRCSDSDPNDRPGWGRCRFRRRRTGITDSDPNDGAGNGRGGRRIRVRRRRRCTDNDPNDGVGRGIRCY